MTQNARGVTRSARRNNVMRAVMSEEKKTDLDRVTLKNETLRRYFPKSYTPKQMEDTIIKLLEGWYKKRQLSQER